MFLFPNADHVLHERLTKIAWGEIVANAASTTGEEQRGGLLRTA